jgi:hypothetical protein
MVGPLRKVFLCPDAWIATGGRHCHDAGSAHRMSPAMPTIRVAGRWSTPGRCAGAPVVAAPDSGALTLSSIHERERMTKEKVIIMARDRRG